MQLVGTAAILGWVPGNPAKLLAMLLVWRIGFGVLARRELVAMTVVNLTFVVMNSTALRRGIFAFNHPDFLQMPIWEYFMWGFYTLHTIRFLGGPVPKGRWIVALAAAVVFALPFGVITDPALLFAAAAPLLGACFALFRERMDLAYAGYMAGLGVLIECVGVWSGQWRYPGQHWGGIPLWSAVMWAGVGVFTRRLILPLLATGERDGG